MYTGALQIESITHAWRRWAVRSIYPFPWNILTVLLLPSDLKTIWFWFHHFFLYWMKERKLKNEKHEISFVLWLYIKHRWLLFMNTCEYYSLLTCFASDKISFLHLIWQLNCCQHFIHSIWVGFAHFQRILFLSTYVFIHPLRCRHT